MEVIQNEMFDFNHTVKADSYTMRVARLAEPQDCICGKDHSKERFMILTLHDTDQDTSRTTVVFEGSELFSAFMDGSIAEDARACLAHLEVDSL